VTLHVSLHLGLGVTLQVSLPLGLGVTLHVSLHLGLGVTLQVSLPLGIGVTLYVSLPVGIGVTLYVSLPVGLGVTLHVSIPLVLGVTLHVSLHLGLRTEADPGFVEHEVYTIFETLLKKRMQNYDYKIRYKSEYSFRMRKEITTNYKFKRAFKYHKHHKIQKNDNIFLLINCLTQFYNTFSLHFLPAYSLIASSYYNNFIISFSIEGKER
jgi:hypothetical protein